MAVRVGAGLKERAGPDLNERVWRLGGCFSQRLQLCGTNGGRNGHRAWGPGGRMKSGHAWRGRMRPGRGKGCGVSWRGGKTKAQGQE